MGAWDSTSFGNDTACDWAYGLKEVNDLSLVESAIYKVGESDYLEAPAAEEAIAAGDTLARLLGRFDVKNSYTELVDDWVAKHKLIPSGKLIQSAQMAIERILTPPSELLELWQESDEFATWQKHLEDLKKRLK